MSLEVFKNVEGSILINVYELKIFIPKDYFDLGIAELNGQILSTIGIFKLCVKDSENGLEKFFTLNSPNTIDIPVEEFMDEKLTLKNDIEETSYTVFTFHKNEIFLKTDTIISSVKNLEKFVNLLHSGHLPLLSYEAIFKQYYQAQIDSGMIFAVPGNTLEGAISEMCRCKDDISTPYRMKKNKTGKPNEFRMINIRQIPKITNVFAGLTFEDINSAIAAGVVKNRKGVKDTEISPMEEILYY